MKGHGTLASKLCRASTAWMGEGGGGNDSGKGKKTVITAGQDSQP